MEILHTTFISDGKRYAFKTFIDGDEAKGVQAKAKKRGYISGIMGTLPEEHAEKLAGKIASFQMAGWILDEALLTK